MGGPSTGHSGQNTKTATGKSQFMRETSVSHLQEISDQQKQL